MNATLSGSSHIAIAKRASAGLLRSNAELIIVSQTGRYGRDKRLDDADVPDKFWVSNGYSAMTQNWDLGDFSANVDTHTKMQTFGVRFRREDVERMLGTHLPLGEATPPATAATLARGRPMSPLWPEWVAELALFVHEVGIDTGLTVEELIVRLDERLIMRGLDAPKRTTVQDTARAVLRRLRAAAK